MRLPELAAVLAAVLLLGAVSVLPAEESGEPGAGAAAEAAAEEPAAEESGEAGEASGEEAPHEYTESELAERRRVEMEIKTSTLVELAHWCRELGLSEGGARDELAARLREYFKLPAPGKPEDDKRKLITIESARSTEYFKLDAVDEDYARLRGNVVVSLKDGESLHRIKAKEILYNKTRNMMSATGDVEYVKEEGDTIETFRGQSITVDMDNWSSVFLDGVTERSVQNNETTYRFSGDVISRSGEKVTVLTDAEISNATNEDAYWSLSASKLWLLPGSDFAVFNGVLKVGEIPMLYIPFFYYPADELIFHPVLGLRSREGSFIQTTTYILGRPKVDTENQSSISKILGNGPDMEKERQGVWLRSTGKKRTDPNEVSLKAMVDFYTNLGGYLGTELTLPAMGIFGATNIAAGFGFSRTIIGPPVTAENTFTPFANWDGVSDWNNSKLFSWEVPFRYRFKIDGSLSAKFGSVSWAFPYFSDPYFEDDFLDRSEEMDWIKLGKEGASALEDEEDEQASLVTSYEWRLNGSVNPQLSFLAPYVSSLSVSSLTSTLAFRTREVTGKGTWDQFKPSRSFYYPDRFTLFSISASAAGTPFSIGGAASSTPAAAETETDPFAGIGVPRSPWPVTETEKNTKTAEPLAPPVLSQSFDTVLRNHRFSVDYRLNPSAAAELQFRNDAAHWKTQEDIDWNEVASVLTIVRGDIGFNFNMEHTGTGLYSDVFSLTGSGVWQDYSYINQEAEQFAEFERDPITGKYDKPVPEEKNTKVKAARKANYEATNFSASYANTFTLRPFYWNTMFNSTNLAYSLKGLLFKTKFTGDGNKPEWEIENGEWKRKYLDTHTLSANLSASIFDQAQTLTISYELPPREQSLSPNLTLRAWIFEANAHTRLVFPTPDPDAETSTSAVIPGTKREGFDYFKFEPLYVTGKLTFGKWASFQQYLVYDYDPHEELAGEERKNKDIVIQDFTTLTSTLSFTPSPFTFSAAYNAVRGKGYQLTDLGWVQKTSDPSLMNRDLSFAASVTSNQTSLWKDRLRFSVTNSNSLNIDLQRYTYSRFNFSLGFTLGITNFIDLTMNATTENAVVFRYLQDLPFFEGENLPTMLGEKNVFLDLINSFRFDNEAKRRSSGFKLKSFSLQATHHLGDWDAVLGVTLSPYLDQETSPPSYRFNNEISFVVKWVPIAEIKSEVTFEKDKWLIK